MQRLLLIPFLLATIVPVIAAEPAPPPAPCSEPVYRQFDFWLGKWTSYNADGEVQGHNHIAAIMDGCALQENWRSARGGGYRGTSFNFYNASTGRWYQTWVDNQGGSLRLEGELKDRRMVLSGQRQAADGTTVTDRITFTPLDDGRVRQHWQSTTDGETWQDTFDGYYVREAQ